MKHLLKTNWILCVVLLLATSGCGNTASASESNSDALTYILPAPRLDSNVSVESALANRRSRRNFQDKPLSVEQLSQMLWAAYGITQPMPHSALRGGLRTTPSAGASFPLEIYVVIGNVTGIEPGVYWYDSENHKIIRTIDRDVRAELRNAALGQAMLRDAPVTIVFTAVYERITARYGERGRLRYVYMEIGHSAQNVYLQAEALGLGTCAIAAFHDDRVSALLQLPADEAPLYLMPVGYFYR